MSTQETPKNEVQAGTSHILERFVLGPRERILAGVVGAGLLVFGALLALLSGSAPVSGVMIVLGVLLFIVGLFGRRGRIAGRIGPAGFSYEPDYEPLADLKPTPGQQPRTGEEEMEATADTALAGNDVASGATEAKKRDLFFEAIMASRRNDWGAFESRMQEAISDAEDEDARVSLDAIRLSWLYNSGRTEKLEELQELRGKYPKLHLPVVRLGECYEAAGQLEKAARVYAEGVASDDLPIDGRLTLLSRQSRALAKAKRFEEAERSLNKGLEMAESDRQKADVHKLLAGLYDEWQKKDEEHWHREKSLELNPGDVDTRFDLAYSYSATGSRLAAVYHYNILVSQRSDPVDVNNLAVELNRLDMPITAMRYFQRAADENYTLAAANLAREAAAHGLVDLAKKMLAEAQKQEKVDDMVLSVASSIVESEKDEKERLDRILDGARSEHSLQLKRIEAERLSRTSLRAENVEGTWKTSLGDITFTQGDDKLNAKFKDGIWDWELSGNVDRRTYSFDWECDNPRRNQHGSGYFVFVNNADFEGIIRHTPTRGEVRVVTGRKQPPKPRSKEGSLPQLGEGSAPDNDPLKLALDFLRRRRPPTQPPGGCRTIPRSRAPGAAVRPSRGPLGEALRCVGGRRPVRWR